MISVQEEKMQLPYLFVTAIMSHIGGRMSYKVMDSIK